MVSQARGHDCRTINDRRSSRGTIHPTTLSPKPLKAVNQLASPSRLPGATGEEGAAGPPSSGEEEGEEEEGEEEKGERMERRGAIVDDRQEREAEADKTAACIGESDLERPPGS